MPAAKILPPVRTGGWVVAAGLFLIIALSLRLAAGAMNPSLSSDVLYPHLFAQNVLAGHYPLTGWSFGGATFFFPDYIIYLPILAATGSGGVSIAIYAAVFFVALAALIAAVARGWADCRPLPAWLAGVLAVNAVLVLQFLPRHLEVLWLFPLPGYHGGTLLNGLALIALVGRLLRPVPTPAPARWLWWATGTVLWLGLAANALLLVQFVAPLVVAAGWLERQGAARRGSTRRLVLLSAAGLAAAMFTRLGLALGDWGYHYRLGFRLTPTPVALWEETGKFLSAVATDLGPRAWGWGGFLACWLLLLTATLRSRKRHPRADVRILALHGLVLLSAIGMTAVLLLTGYWKDWSNIRYLLNVLLLPPVVLAVAMARRASARSEQGPPSRPRGQWAALLPALLLTLAGGGALATTRRADWSFQPSSAAREFASLVERHHLHQGLAGYWQSNLLDVLAAPPRLNTLQPNGQPYFWCNNAFWYFAPPEPDGTMRWPTVDFILTEGLDRTALRAQFGPPSEVVQEGGWEVFIYDAAGQARIRSLLASEVVSKLGPSRLRGLHPVF